MPAGSRCWAGGGGKEDFSSQLNLLENLACSPYAENSTYVRTCTRCWLRPHQVLPSCCALLPCLIPSPTHGQKALVQYWEHPSALRMAVLQAHTSAQKAGREPLRIPISAGMLVTALSVAWAKPLPSLPCNIPKETSRTSTPGWRKNRTEVYIGIPGNHMTPGNRKGHKGCIADA